MSKSTSKPKFQLKDLKELFQSSFTLAEHTDTAWSFDLGATHITLIGTGLGTEGDAPRTGMVTSVVVTLEDGTVTSHGDLSIPAVAVSKGLRFSDGEHPGKELKGGDGRDDLAGGGGDDHLHGGRGSDHLRGGGGHDDLDGGTGDDRLDGGLGDDDLAGGAGNDSLDGGVGTDTAHFDDSAKAVTVDLAKGRATGEGTDTLRNVEDVAGSRHGDRLNGNAGNNALNGGDGADVLNGNAGDDRLSGGTGADKLHGGNGKDVLEGGAGSDMLTGGGGGDTFVFAHATGDGIDRVTDFRHGQDRIELDHTGFTEIGVAGPLDPDAFFLGATAHDADDRILYDAKTGALSYDADGSGNAAAVQFAILKPHLKLTADDFHIV